MAKQRVVNTKFWDDDYVMELSPNEKLLFLYLITNTLTDLCGAYQITLKRISFDTGLKIAKIQEILTRLEVDRKVAYREGWILIKNFGKHQSGASPNIAKGVERSLSACPDWIKQTLSKGFETLLDENALLPEPIGITLTPSEPLVETPPKATAKKGTRLPDAFPLTTEMRAWAHERKPDVDLALETEKFCNYFRAAPGTKGTKLDWLLTWKNWILNAKGNSNGINQNSNGSNRKQTPAEIIAGRSYR